MKSTPPSPWIHIGECPFCVNGLVRVRSCHEENNDLHLYALCDECEAIWLTPSTEDERIFPDPEQPVCPCCSGELYGSCSRWATAEDLADSEWQAQVIFTVPSESEPPESLTPDDEPKPGC